MAQPAPSRSTSRTVAMLVFVCAAGAGGLLLGRQFSHAPTQGQAVSGNRPAERPAPTSAHVTQPAETAPTGGATTADAGGKPVPNAGGDSAAGAAADSVDPEKPGYVTENEQIQLVLRRWQTALLSNDAAQVAPSYAASVERYFLQTGVSRGYVQKYMRAEEARGSQLMSYDLRDVQITHVSADEVDVRFVAKFTVRTPDDERSGSARTLLKLRPEDGDWKIFYERDFRS